MSTEVVGYGPRARPGFVVSPQVLTWDVAVYRVSPQPSGSRAGRSFVVCLPADDAPTWLAALDGGVLDDELLDRLAAPPDRRLRSVPRRTRARLRDRPRRLGVEHEFTVVDDGRQVDFRSLLPRLPVDGPQADPIDTRARRLPWGVLTADGPEAEIATDPVPLEPGFARRASAAAATGRAELERALPQEARTVGYSTHVSVSWSDRGDLRRTRAWARTFAPAMMLLLDGIASPGLLVRPRPGRLELGGDFVDGDDLAAAVAFAVGSVLALEQQPRSVRALALDVPLERAVERFGWFVDRRAFGADLYEQGRTTILRRRAGESRLVSAQDHLEQVVELVTHALDGVADDVDLHPLHARAGGLVGLPCERDQPPPLLEAAGEEVGAR